MKIFHRYSANLSQDVVDELTALGIDVDLTADFFVFEVDEDDFRWPAVREWAERDNQIGSVWTTFSREEIEAARWLRLLPQWHHGFPQPEQDWGYFELTYDLSGFCNECGTGFRQAAPFRMRREPKWGRRSIMQLNWVFDEYFVKPEVWEQVFAPFGIGRRPATDKHGKELETVVQLVIDEEVEIDTSQMAGEVCPACGRVKHPPFVRGYFPALRSEPKGKAVRVAQWFGSGGAANSEIIVARDVRVAMEAANVRGAEFEPVAES